MTRAQSRPSRTGPSYIIAVGNRRMNVTLVIALTLSPCWNGKILGFPTRRHSSRDVVHSWPVIDALSGKRSQARKSAVRSPMERETKKRRGARPRKSGRGRRRPSRIERSLCVRRYRDGEYREVVGHRMYLFQCQGRRVAAVAVRPHHGARDQRIGDASWPSTRSNHPRPRARQGRPADRGRQRQGGV